MAYTTAKIDRRNLVRLAGWGMTGLRPPGRGNLHHSSIVPSSMAGQPTAVQPGAMPSDARAGDTARA